MQQQNRDHCTRAHSRARAKQKYRTKQVLMDKMAEKRNTANPGVSTAHRYAREATAQPYVTYQGLSAVLNLRDAMLTAAAQLQLHAGVVISSAGLLWFTW